MWFLIRSASEFSLALLFVYYENAAMIDRKFYILLTFFVVFVMRYRFRISDILSDEFGDRDKFITHID